MQARGDRLRRRAALITVAVALVLGATACAGSAGSDGSDAAKAPTSANPSAPGTASAQGAVKQGAGGSTCARVRDVFVHLAIVSATWDPGTDPFDAHTAAAFAPLIRQLRAESASATSGRLHDTVERNADALSHLATAMALHQQARVTAALADSRRAYAALPSCARRDGRAANTGTSASPGVPPGSSTRPATSQPVGNLGAAAKDPGCIAAKTAYDKLGPVTATWDISSDPFDAKVAQAFRDTADALDSAADHAKVPGVADRAKANAAAFRLLADSMGSKDAAQVDDSVITMQQTAVSLASTCPLS